MQMKLQEHTLSTVLHPSHLCSSQAEGRKWRTETHRKSKEECKDNAEYIGLLISPIFHCSTGIHSCGIFKMKDYVLKFTRAQDPKAHIKHTHIQTHAFEYFEEVKTGKNGMATKNFLHFCWTKVREHSWSIGGIAINRKERTCGLCVVNDKETCFQHCYFYFLADFHRRKYPRSYPLSPAHSNTCVVGIIF